MNKEQALQRLSAIEKETAELKKIIEAKDVPNVFQGRLLELEANSQTHYYLDYAGDVLRGVYGSDLSKMGSAFATREAAYQYAEHLHLMQEARIAMAQDWGDVKCDWSLPSHKYMICMHIDVAIKDYWAYVYHPIHFRTKEARDKFFDKYTQEELRLMIMGVE